MFSFTAKKSDLARAIKLCKGVVERKSTIPIIQNIHAHSLNGSMILTATDMDMEISVMLTTAGNGGNTATTFPAHVFGDIVGKAADENITASVSDDTLRIQAGKAKFTLGTLPADDFPVFSRSESVITEISIEAHDLAELLDSTRHAASTEETRHYLNGIFLHHYQGLLRAVATDGNRLALIDTPVNDGVNEDTPAIILPSKAAALARGMLEDITGPVTVALSKAHAAFVLPPAGITFTTKLVDGTYPDYQRVIPANNPLAFRVEKAALTAALDRVSTVAIDKTRVVKLRFTEGRLTIVCDQKDIAYAEEYIDIDWAHQPFTIGFNSIFLLSALARMP